MEGDEEICLFSSHSSQHFHPTAYPVVLWILLTPMQA
jgi:hypothetical protein